MNNENYVDIAREIRKNIVKMHVKAKSPHLGSSLSIVEILVALYFNILKLNPKEPMWEERDRFILSKGHACSALYVTLALKGFFSEKYLEYYYTDGGKLFGHITKDIVPGIEASSGSLGHGLSMGIGMAIAGKYDRKNFRAFVLLSDGECEEGSVWEGALFVSHHKLDNLVAIVDYNKLQAFGRTNEVINLEPFAEKWRSFGWTVKEVDGHNIEQLIQTLKNIPFEKNKPNVVIAHTIKGKGISFIEDKLESHYKLLNEQELTISLKEISLK